MALTIAEKYLDAAGSGQPGILQKYRGAIAILLFLVPTALALQPFFPKLIQWTILYGRLIIAPIFILYFLWEQVNFFILAMFVAFVLATTIISFPSDINDAAVIFFTLFSSIAFHKFGQFLSSREIDKKLLLALAYGTILINVITIVVYYSLGFGYIDMEWFLTTAGKGFLEPLFRFSLGNPIEVPLVITCLLYAAILLLRKRENLLFTAGINLATAILSQSRLIVFIALLIFLVEFWRASMIKKMVIVGIVAASVPVFVTEFGFIVESFVNRLGGDDMGSASDRQLMVDLIVHDFNPLRFFTGGGITSSSELLKAKTGDYRTVESVFLQFYYELGLIGSLLFFGAIYFRRRTVVLPRISFSLIMILIYLEVFLFINIYTLLPAIFLLFGIAETGRTAEKSIPI